MKATAILLHIALITASPDAIVKHRILFQLPSVKHRQIFRL